MNSHQKHLKELSRITFEENLPDLLKRHQTLSQSVEEKFKSLESTKNKRLAICQQCSEYKKSSDIEYCDFCRCLLVSLINFKKTICPMQKWVAENDIDD